ncbi:MAG TPA: hypothetical protein VGM73_11640 [Candidatus Didemnitutus sp.]|jgi:predicted GH43/DUF377 family glycosyl hydrolase
MHRIIPGSVRFGAAIQVGLIVLALMPFAVGAEDTFAFEPAKPPPHQAHFEITRMVADPVLTRGTAKSDWDHVDLLNPSVLRTADGFEAFYSGFNGTIWQTGVATSPDGLTWTKQPGNPVLAPGATRYARTAIAANGDAFIVGGQVHYVFQGQDEHGTPTIGEGISVDGRTFPILSSRPVIDAGPKGAWDEVGVGDPSVIAHGGTYYLYYLGMNAAGAQRIGVARSTDGVAWQKYAGNPIVDAGPAGSFDENGIGEPAVVFVAPNFYMLYTGRDAHEGRNLGLAVARDPVHWRKISREPLVSAAMRHDWDRAVVCDPSIVRDGRGGLLVFFGGGDVAHPAHGLDGNVGLFFARAGTQRNSFDTAAEWKDDDSTDALIGSFPIETSDGGRFAWTGPSAEITLSAEVPKSVRLIGWIPMPLYRARHVADHVTLTVRVGNRVVGTIASDAKPDGSFDASFPLAGIPSDEGAYTFALTADQALPPTASDQRTLSYIVRRIELQ